MSSADLLFIYSIKSGGLKRERSIRKFFQKNFGYVKKSIFEHQISHDEALDTYTDAILDLCRQIENENFRGENKLSSLLYKIYQRRIIDLLRHKRSQKSEFWNQIRKELPYHLVSPNESSENQFIRFESFRILKAMIAEAGKGCLEILMDMIYAGYSSEEVAKRYGYSSAASVRNRKKKCIENVQKLIVKQKDLF